MKTATATTPRKPRSKTMAPAHAHAQSGTGHADHSEHIAVSAYFKAQARGFAPGFELDDWLQAEAELAGASPRG